MPTDEIKQAVKLLDFKKQGGMVSALSALILITIFILKLSDAQVERIKSVWPLLLVAPGIILLAWMWTAYIHEMKNRLKVEEGINANLAILAANFERLFDRIESLFAKELDNKIYFDGEFTEIKDRLRSIFFAMEKRGGYQPGSDTERFMQQKE